MNEQVVNELEKSVAPCPCCGHHAHIHVSGDGSGRGFVACDDTFGCGVTNGLADIETAVKRWNRRAA